MECWRHQNTYNYQNPRNPRHPCHPRFRRKYVHTVSPKKHQNPANPWILWILIQNNKFPNYWSLKSDNYPRKTWHTPYLLIQCAYATEKQDSQHRWYCAAIHTPIASTRRGIAWNVSRDTTRHPNLFSRDVVTEQPSSVGGSPRKRRRLRRIYSHAAGNRRTVAPWIARLCREKRHHIPAIGR